jgi:hypothetical protein
MTALADHIATALREERPSQEIASLIAEAEQSRTVTERDRDAARARALDPTAGVEAASAAKRATDDLRFEVERLDCAVEALRRAHREAKA